MEPFRIAAILVCTGLLTAIPSGVANAFVDPYCVRIQFIQTLQGGKEKIAFDHSVGVQISKPPQEKDTRLHLRSGQDDTSLDRPQSGDYLRAGLYRKGEQVFLDAIAYMGQHQAGGPDAIRITTLGLRLMEPVTIGKKITVPVVQGRWEVIVERSPRQGVPYTPPQH